ncbi:type VI secretion system baseplate subunit TssK [Ectothiorhodospiraceae bacterium WFHF3C12]|nr:type VI secretion system baseplate subunit TssK [Ectothiorhodospiraceae bacterium WFHF3C12]
MSRNSRILWSEGLFLEPQHFQQHDRYMEGYVEGRVAALAAYGWGFQALELESDLSALGRLGLRSARGVFPDGTPFAMPDDDPLPAPLEVDESVRDRIVYLALPLRADGAVEVQRGSSSEGLFRYRAEDVEVRDSVLDSAASSIVEVGRLNARLALEGEALEEYACIALARIVERRSDGQVILDEEFIPSVLRAAAARRLGNFINELRGTLEQRAEYLAERVTASGSGGASEISDFLMLQVINRHAPVIAHLAETGHVHPEHLYTRLLELAGELATLTTEKRRPPEFGSYRHDSLTACFEPVFELLRSEFRAVRESPATLIPLEATGRHGIRVARIEDPSLFDTANFVLAVSASLPAEEIRQRFPNQVKVGPVERIAELVNNNLPGVELVPVPVAPRQIPYYANTVYFELSRSGSLWKQLSASGGLAVHVAGQFPDLKLDLWAIRGQTR